MPAIYIDNRKADAKEADRLRPKDMVRVEYYDRPSASFPGEATVLNFITRKYDRGGYVDARTATYLYPPCKAAPTPCRRASTHGGST